MSTGKNVLSERVTQSSFYCLLLCPYCKNSIADISLIRGKDTMYLYLKCPCLGKDKFIALKAFMKEMSSLSICKRHGEKEEKQCSTCLLTLCKECMKQHFYYAKSHSLRQAVLNARCLEHKKPYSFYCNDCQKNICSKCQQTHESHTMTKMNKLDVPLISINELDQLMIRNRKVTETLSAKMSPEKKEDIMTVFNATEETNQYLKLLYQRFLTTVAYVKNTQVYQLQRMVKTIKLNTEEFVAKDWESIEETYIRLRKHLQLNYILIQDNTQVNHKKESLIGSEEDIWSLIQLKDGRLAFCSGDGFIKLWDLTTNQSLTKINSGFAMIFLQLKDERLAIASYKSIKLRDKTTHRIKGELEGHTKRIRSLIQLKDGRIVSGSEDKTVKLWDATTNDCKATLTGHSKSVNCLLQLVDDTLASGSLDRTIKIWNLFTSQCITTLIENYSVNSLLQLEDGRIISGKYSSITLWEGISKKFQIVCTDRLSSKEKVKWLKKEEEGQCLLHLNDGRIAFGTEKEIGLWNNTSTGLTFSFRLDSPCERIIQCLIQLNDGRIASCCIYKSAGRHLPFFSFQLIQLYIV